MEPNKNQECRKCKGTKGIDLHGNPSEFGICCPNCYPKAYKPDGHKYWLIWTVGDVEPELHGPYNTIARQERAALNLVKTDPNRENGIFGLSINPRGKPKIYPFPGGFTELAFKNEDRT